MDRTAKFDMGTIGDSNFGMTGHPRVVHMTSDTYVQSAELYCVNTVNINQKEIQLFSVESYCRMLLQGGLRSSLDFTILTTSSLHGNGDTCLWHRHLSNGAEYHPVPQC